MFRLMSGITRSLFGVGLAMLLGVGVNADEAAETPVQPYGSLFRALAGDTLEREHGVAVLGFAPLDCRGQPQSRPEPHAARPGP